MHNIFIIGKAQKAYVSLPTGKGIRLTVTEERDKRLKMKSAAWSTLILVDFVEE